MKRLLALPMLVLLASTVHADPPNPPTSGQRIIWLMNGSGGCSGSVSGCCPVQLGSSTHAVCPMVALKKAMLANPCAGLIEIMETTKDPDTFLMAVAALPALEKKASQALPVVVKNAERLGLLKGLSQGSWTPAQQRLLGSVQQIGAPADAPPPPVVYSQPYGYGAPTQAVAVCPDMGREAPAMPAGMMLPPPSCLSHPACYEAPAAPEKLGPPRSCPCDSSKHDASDYDYNGPG
jgi:hypothetical protein